MHGLILLCNTKNGESRELPMNDALRGVLQKIPRKLHIPYVFIDTDTGKPLQDIRRSFHTALKKAGIRDFHFHDLRHTFASQLVMAGIDITTVKKLLGHKTLTMTLRYAHLSCSHKTNALDTLNNLLTGKSSAQKVHNSAVGE